MRLASVPASLSDPQHSPVVTLVSLALISEKLRCSCSIYGEVRVTYDLAPFPRIGCDELPEFIRRPQNRLQQLRCQILLPQLGVAHNLAYVGIDLGDNFTGCFGWGEQTEPIRGFVPRQAALIYCRDVGKLWASFETAYRQYIDFPSLAADRAIIGPNEIICMCPR